ncbi:MAG: TIGR01777 family oxidoreductase [Planctomycetaceae bacterium]|nr:TIGR01777 family oxidoreductase [Planctomycetaceae bacterium]
MANGERDDTAKIDTSETVTQARTRVIAVSGAGGLIGSMLVEQLPTQGRSVIRLVRETPRSAIHEVQWDTEGGLVNPTRLEGIFGVVHLAGENIAGGRWTEDRKRRIRESRVQGTETLCRNLALLHRKPKVLVCASAIGYYGDRGDEMLDESSPAGHGFLPGVCQEWEQATAPAAEAGIRVVNLRFGIVLSTAGGALEKMLTPFKMGAGGKVGSGKQYWSWVALADVVGAIVHALDCETISGPVNVVSPNAVTNAEFTETLGRVLHRPTVLPMPAFAARLALGEMADELLLASAHVVPSQLQRTGYDFQFPDLQECLQHELTSKPT